MAMNDFLGSAMVAALVAGLVSFRSPDRKIQIENIAQERAKWREKIRANALLVQQAAVGREPIKLDELHFTFRLLLNPHEEEDQLILLTIENLKSVGKLRLRLAEFSSRVALLLKHDWERAKHEAKPWFLAFRAPKRRPYAEVLERRALWDDTEPEAQWDDRKAKRNR
jgi:hypothetical protein